LYLNRSKPGQLRFEEKAQACGVAVDDRGRANGNMGIAAGDYEGTGRPSLFITTYQDEQHALYRNFGSGFFRHWSHGAGILELSPHFLGWGTWFFDLDNDGWEDLVIAHGHVQRHPTSSHGKARVAQHAVLLRNLGNGRFHDVTARGGSYF